MTGLSPKPLVVDAAVPVITNQLDAKAINALQVANVWLSEFGKGCEAGNVEGVCDLIWEEGFWRDLLPLTWCYRSLGGMDGGKNRIRQALQDRLAISKFSNFRIDKSFEQPKIESPLPHLSYIVFWFTFDCKAGNGSGIARLIPSKSTQNAWEALTVFTLLEELEGIKASVGEHRMPHYHHHSSVWSDDRQKETAFEDREPEVLIVGAGQAGLDLAARLKVINVDTLIVERLPQVGAKWATRYGALRLHDPVYYNHMAYMPFPTTWPIFCPAAKLAAWLQSYAVQLDLNVWTSTTVKSCSFDNKAGRWTVSVARDIDGKVKERTLNPKICVYAGGLTGGDPLIPELEGKDTFEGKILHSSQYTTAEECKGMRVVVVGAGTSGHDICKDLAESGVDVNMIQRSSTYVLSLERGQAAVMHGLYDANSPPTEIADRIAASSPLALTKELHKYLTKHIGENLDKKLLDGLRSVGFQLNFGEDGSGLLILARARGGGFYIDVGASKLIMDGKIKIKSGSGVRGFTQNEILFEDGTSMNADYVIFATGFGDPSGPIKKMFGEAAKYCQPMGGFDYEREIQGIACAGSGVPHLYVFGGNLATCRFNSKPLSLQIKAELDGIFKEEDRYTLTSSMRNQ